MNRVRLLLSTMFFLFLVYGQVSRASESYFAQDFVRGIFAITIEDPIIHTHEKEVESRSSKGLQETDETWALPQKLSLLIWNIHKGEMLGEKKLPFSLKAYDFVLLQENRWKWSLKNLDYRGYHYFVPTFSQSGNKTGLSIISRYPATKVRGFHTNYYEPFIISPKSFLVMEFENLAVINVHSLNFVVFEEWQAELNRLCKLAKELLQKKGALIVAGDFNTWSEERMETLKSKFTEIGLQEITFKKDLRSRALGLPLDGVYSSGYRLRDSNVFPAEDFSDHNPMEVVLERTPSN